MVEWLAANVAEALTSISIIIALLTWFFTQRRERAARRMAHTADAIAGLSTSDRLAESNFQLAKLMDAGERIDPSEIDDATRRHVIDILNYYEYLCELYGRGILDKDTIVHLRGGLMVRTYQVCQDYIRARREEQARPEMFLKLERLVQELTAAA